MIRKKSDHTKALDKADTEFSLLMRAIEADEYGMVRCVTCGKVGPWKGTGKFHWGHYKSRGFNSIRFDPMNGGVQDVQCNSFKEGEGVKMRAYLVGRYGESQVLRIEASCNIRHSISDFELGLFAKAFRAERIKIEKQKGL
jgi:hypothetical protein